MRSHVIRSQLMTQWTNRPGNRALSVALLVGVMLVILPGCAATREAGKPLRTAVQQLLLSQALQRTLQTVSLPLPDDAAIIVEAVGLTRDYAADQEYARQVIALHLAKQGFRLAQNEGEATYRINVLLQAFGSEQGIAFFGMPPVQSVLLPFSLPELSLYKDFHESGHVRWALTVSERSNGRVIFSSPWYAASTYHNHYTILLVIRFVRTDLDLPE